MNLSDYKKACAVRSEIIRANAGKRMAGRAQDQLTVPILPKHPMVLECYDRDGDFLYCIRPGEELPGEVVKTKTVKAKW
jgi:hypothetical protein